MKNILALFLITFMAIFAFNAAAIPTVKIEWANSNHSPTGGEFLLTPSEGSPFNTFCIERDQYITVGGTYAYLISDSADSGNDPISIGTAWLYNQFRLGTLTGYGLDQQGHLQNAIWYLEGELTEGQINRSDYEYVKLARNSLPLGTDVFSDADGAFGVVVWNLYDRCGGPAQSQLGFGVPDGGSTLAMAGMGLAGILTFRRKQK